MSVSLPVNVGGKQPHHCWTVHHTPRKHNSFFESQIQDLCIRSRTRTDLLIDTTPRTKRPVVMLPFTHLMHGFLLGVRGIFVFTICYMLFASQRHEMYFASAPPRHAHRNQCYKCQSVLCQNTNRNTFSASFQGHGQIFCQAPDIRLCTYST